MKSLVNFFLTIAVLCFISCDNSTEPIEYTLENTIWELVKKVIGGGWSGYEEVIIISPNEGEEYSMNLENNSGFIIDACNTCDFQYEVPTAIDNEIIFYFIPKTK